MKPEKRKNGWLGRICVNGQRESKQFPTHREAVQWSRDRESELRSSGQPKGNGPNRTTLAEALKMFAESGRCNKKGAPQELTRINRWLAAANMPRLRLVTNDNGVRDIQEEDSPMSLPRTFSEWRNKRLKRSKQSDDKRAQLGVMLMSKIAPYHIKEFEDSLIKSGLKADTIINELTLLRTLFNMSRDVWLWTYNSFPFKAYEMPKPGDGRDVRVPEEKEEELYEQLARCKSNFILPYVLLAVETTMRRGEMLFNVTWDDVDLDRRLITLRNTKNGKSRKVPLTQFAVELLRKMARVEGDNRLFPITANQLFALIEN